MKQVNAEKDPAAQKTLAREQALPAKIDMIQAAGDMVRALLAAMVKSHGRNGLEVSNLSLLTYSWRKVSWKTSSTRSCCRMNCLRKA